MEKETVSAIGKILDHPEIVRLLHLRHTTVRASVPGVRTEKEVTPMDYGKVPIGFGLALSSNTAAMNRYSRMTEQEKQDILNRAHNVYSDREMYALVASLANGTLQ